jgi:hypothetical protein
MAVKRGGGGTGIRMQLLHTEKNKFQKSNQIQIMFFTSSESQDTHHPSSSWQ